MVDVGPGWLLITEASEPALGLRPSVHLLFKQSRRLLKLFDVDNYSTRRTGFTYSRGSAAACDGVFFSFRAANDVFERAPERILRWTIRFD